MIKQIIIRHKVIIYIVIIFILAAYLWNLFIPKNTIVMAGEYIFSFDDLGHVSNILHDTRSLDATDYTNCFDCIDFYHYSRWYSLFKIGYHAIGQIIGLHPFIFLILSAIVTQLVSLYIFAKIHFKKFEWFAFGIASFLFIAYPYKYSLLVETHDGLLYSNMIIYLSFLLLFFKKIGNNSYRKTLLLAIVNGFLFSFFLNVNIAFFPIAFYMTLILIVFYAKELKQNFLKILLYLPVFTLPSLLINFSFIKSILKLGNSRHYEGYISFNAVDSWLAGLFTAQTNNKIILIFIIMFIITFFIAKISLKMKSLLLGLYICIAIMILGTNSSINIYGWMFEHIPLLDSLRATYRYMFFELLIIFIFIYHTCLYSDRNKLVKILVFGLSSLCIILPIVHIYTHKDYFYVSHLPQEYFIAQKYVNSLSGDKMVFPQTSLLFHNITTDYSWSDSTYTKSILLYKNPFTSLLPLRNLVQFERFPYLLSPRFLELRYLTDFRNRQEDIIQAMEMRGIKYLVIDENYKWKDNYPQFDLDHFISLGKINRKFGNIIIMQLPDRSKECQEGYGTISLNFCTTYGQKVKLLSKSKLDYQLETSPDKIGQSLQLRKNSIYTKSILDPQIYDIFIQNHIIFNKNIIQMFGEQKNIYSSGILKTGHYILYTQIFSYKDEKHLMGDASLGINISGKRMKQILSGSNSGELLWYSTKLDIKDNENITVDIDKKGYVILGSAPILKKL